MNPAGTKLCVAGTMSDYAAIVAARRPSPTSSSPVGQKPYWATNSGDGRYCFVSFSGDDRGRGDLLRDREARSRSVPVGDHPQRMRMGALAEGALGVGPGSSPGRPGGPRPKLRVTVRPKRVRVGRPVRLRVRVTVKRAGRRVAVRGARVRVAGVRGRTGRRGRATLRKRHGLERVRRYRVRASRRGYRTGFARVRATRG